MPNLVELVIKLADAFDRLQVPFAIGGALANNIWGVVRAAFDIDCLIAVPALKYQMLVDELDVIGCVLHDAADKPVPVSVPRLREQVSKQSLIECFQNSVRIELFVPAVPLQSEILRRAVKVPINGRDVSVTTAEDLILQKLAFHRPKDLQDVRGILWVQRGHLDLDYLKRWSAKTHEADIQRELEELIVEYGQQNQDGE